MTYARARLWLGICGVGTHVLIAATMIATQFPGRVLPGRESTVREAIAALLLVLACFVVVTLPFDVLGGWLLPKAFGRPTPGPARSVRNWGIGVVMQSTLFLLTALAVLAAGRSAGVGGGLCIVLLVSCALISFQGRLLRVVTPVDTKGAESVRGPLRQRLEAWGVSPRPLTVLEHSDEGFTGGIVGVPGGERILIPQLWLKKLSTDQLAVVVARRCEAITNGSRGRGLLVALAWNTVGFVLATQLPGAGVNSVAELVTTYCGCTCWMFAGLLVLPSLSRLAAHAIDSQVLRKGVPSDLLGNTLAVLDRLQDHEPDRPRLIEAIFHPVPSVRNRERPAARTARGAWHAARMTLLLSWSCLSPLSRAVHCNAGRPELWLALPTD